MQLWNCSGCLAVAFDERNNHHEQAFRCSSQPATRRHRSEHSGYHETLQERQYVRTRKQEQNRREKEVAWLDDEFESLAEWRQRREFQPIWEPGTPQDEMTYQDFKKARDPNRKLYVEITEKDLSNG
jgi:hypothetical protein